MKKIFFGIVFVILSGCMGMPENITPVEDFILEKYLGKWYEIARMDHSFERGLDNVTAFYSIREQGGISVKNRGYSADKKSWREAEGKAYFAGNNNEGYLRVSFFGPFYSSYVIFELDEENYQYAFVSGYNNSYLWLLSRTPTVDERTISRFIEKARNNGFDTDKLIFVKHDNKQKNDIQNR